MNESAPVADGELSLVDIQHALWRGRLIILTLAITLSVMFALYSLTLEDIFRSEALLAPPASESGGIGNQFGLAASFVGLYTTPRNSNVTNALAVLQSREFLIQFMENRNVVPWLFASSYSAESGSSTINANLYNEATQEWVTGNEAATEPSKLQAYNLFRNLLEVNQAADTGLVRVAITWRDPLLASNWVNWLVQDVNDHVKAKDMREASQSIAYLQEQLRSTQLVEMQRAFNQLIESQTRTLMLADVRSGYVFETIDPAIIPEQSIGPNRGLVSILGLIVGVAIGVLISLVRYFWADLE